MSMQDILSTLKRLVQLHESLLQLSLTKTDLLKTGKIEEVEDILKTEQKHVQAINQLEKKRLEAVDEWAIEHGLTDDEKIVTTMIEKTTDVEERRELEAQSTALAKALVELKAQEALNQELTNQSLQFVQMNLALLSPTIEQMNYGHAKGKNDPQSKRSVFDSKA